MNATRHLIVAIIGSAFGMGALAQEATPDTWMGASSLKSRVQVEEELQQARLDGSIDFTALGYDFVARSLATKMRDEVRSELLAAKHSGEYSALNSEVHAFQSADISQGGVVASR